MKKLTDFIGKTNSAPENSTPETDGLSTGNSIPSSSAFENTSVFHAETVDNFKKMGYKAASQTSASLERLLTDLDSVRLQLVIAADQVRDRLNFKNRVERTEGEIMADEEKYASLEAQIQGVEKEIAETKEKLAQTSTDRALMEEKSSFSGVKFWTCLITVALVGAYLLLFYMSALNSALFKQIEFDNFDDLQALMNSIFDTAVLTDWLPQHPFIIMGAFLFMGFGMVPHMLKSRAGFAEKSAGMQWLSITGAYVACFLVDALIAYKIDHNIHQTAYAMGMTNDEWIFWKSENFYIVLALGFGAYVVWGLFYDRLVEENNKRNPLNVLVLRARQLRSAIGDLEAKLITLNQSLAETEAGLRTKRSILKNLQDNSDQITFNPHAIRKNCNEYFSGFVTYIAQNEEYLSVNAAQARQQFDLFKAEHLESISVLSKAA